MEQKESVRQLRLIGNWHGIEKEEEIAKLMGVVFGGGQLSREEPGHGACYYIDKEINRKRDGGEKVNTIHLKESKEKL